MNERTYLCFDHGEQRIGVAVGQSVTSTATALEIIKVTRGKPDWNRISAILRQWKPDELIIGHPLTMEGERQAATDAAEKFARQLHGRYHLPVHLCDERLSSREAQNHLQDSYDVDAVAAQLILETWLIDNTNITTSATIQPQFETGEPE